MQSLGSELNAMEVTIISITTVITIVPTNTMITIISMTTIITLATILTITTTVTIIAISTVLTMITITLSPHYPRKKKDPVYINMRNPIPQNLYRIPNNDPKP